MWINVTKPSCEWIWRPSMVWIDETGLSREGIWRTLLDVNRGLIMVWLDGPIMRGKLLNPLWYRSIWRTHHIRKFVKPVMVRIDWSMILPWMRICWTHYKWDLMVWRSYYIASTVCIDHAYLLIYGNLGRLGYILMWLWIRRVTLLLSLNVDDGCKVGR